MKAKHAGRVPEYLQHILDAIDRAKSYVAGTDFGEFEGDTRTQDAVIRTIGTAALLLYGRRPIRYR